MSLTGNFLKLLLLFASTCGVSRAQNSDSTTSLLQVECTSTNYQSSIVNFTQTATTWGTSTQIQDVTRTVATVTVTLAASSQPASILTVTELVTHIIPPASTIIVTPPAVTITAIYPPVVSTLTVIQTAAAAQPLKPPPTNIVDKNSCPAVNGSIYALNHNYVLACSSAYGTGPSIWGVRGISTTSLYDCARICDSLTSRGDICAAANFNSQTSVCFPMAPASGSLLPAALVYDTAVRIFAK